MKQESEDEFDRMEKDRMQDIKERDEFAVRLRDKDKEKRRNIAEKSDKKVFIRILALDSSMVRSKS